MLLGNGVLAALPQYILHKSLPQDNISIKPPETPSGMPVALKKKKKKLMKNINCDD